MRAGCFVVDGREDAYCFEQATDPTLGAPAAPLDLRDGFAHDHGDREREHERRHEERRELETATDDERRGRERRDREGCPAPLVKPTNTNGKGRIARNGAATSPWSPPAATMANAPNGIASWARRLQRGHGATTPITPRTTAASADGTICSSTSVVRNRACEHNASTPATRNTAEEIRGLSASTSNSRQRSRRSRHARRARGPCCPPTAPVCRGHSHPAAVSARCRMALSESSRNSADALGCRPMSDLFSVSGKVALVTGGSRGIGLMIARGFVEGGAKVYISSRKAEVCDEVAAELSKVGECISVPADLATEAACIALAERDRAHASRRCTSS